MFEPGDLCAVHKGLAYQKQPKGFRSSTHYVPALCVMTLKSPTRVLWGEFLLDCGRVLLLRPFEASIVLKLKDADMSCEL